MKLLVLACLVALALARENEELRVAAEASESFSSSEESVAPINRKIEKAKYEEQQQKQNERQDKIHPFNLPQSPFYPYAEPIPYGQPLPYTPLPQHILPVAQPAMIPALPVLQPEVIETLKAKETILPKNKQMPFLRLLSLASLDPQISNQYLALSLLQPMVHQVPSTFPQPPVLPSLPQLPVLQSRVPPAHQQVVPHPQKEMPIQELQLSQDLLLDPTHPTHQVPVPQLLARAYDPIIALRGF